MFAKQKEVGSSLTLDQFFCARNFGFVRLFFANFFNVSKGSSLQFFLLFCNRMDVQKIPKGALFYIFRHYATYRRLQKNFEKKIR